VPRLTLEQTMQTSFADIRDPSSDKAFHDYNRRIAYLAENGRLQEEDFRELIAPDQDVSAAIGDVADTALSERFSGQQLYLPGYSAVVVEENGSIIGVQEKPNDIAKLSSYGPGLMWAMRKIGEERLAAKRTASSASIMPGYAVVGQVLRGKELAEMPYGDRHHVGGATEQLFLHPLSSSMRQFEHILVHAGVSGVVARPEFQQMAQTNPQTRQIYEQANSHFDTWLDGFDGNMFAGSLDSTLGAFMLSEVVGNPIEGTLAFTKQALRSIVSRHQDGVNVH
jgi:hypothetical protein